MTAGLKLLLGNIVFLSLWMATVLLSPTYTLPASEFTRLVFKRSGQTDDVNHYKIEQAEDVSLERRAMYQKCQSGNLLSKYCNVAAKHCFPQSVTVHFGPHFSTIPKVMIGLNLIDANKDHNVRVHVVVKLVTTSYFVVSFQPWDVSITHRLGVYWMACP